MSWLRGIRRCCGCSYKLVLICIIILRLSIPCTSRRRLSPSFIPPTSTTICRRSYYPSSCSSNVVIIASVDRFQGPPASANTIMQAAVRDDNEAVTASSTTDDPEKEDEFDDEEYFRAYFGLGGSKAAKLRKPKAPPKYPTPIVLNPGVPVEVWVDKQLTFGNLIGRSPGVKASVRIRLQHADIIAVDAGQITSVWWNSMNHEKGPSTPEAWATLNVNAAKALRSLTPKSLALNDFWSLATARWKRDKAPIDSGHLAAFLFARTEYEKALKEQARQQAAVDGGQAAPAGGGGADEFFNLPTITAGQRYAAAILLASETFRFKRVVPEDLEAPEGREEDGSLILKGVGFRPLEQSVVHSREVFSFCQAIRQAEERRRVLGEEEEDGRVSRAEAASAAGGGGGDGSNENRGSAQWDASQWRMLHHLEVFALGAGVEGLSSTSKQVLKALGEKATPEGARSLLLRAGYWTPTTQKGQQRGASSSSSSIDGRKRGDGDTTADDDDDKTEVMPLSRTATPWSEDILALAREAMEKQDKRRAGYKKVATPNRPGRRGPHRRHDYREAGLGAYCLDPAGSEIADDALSYDPNTNEVLIHIADIQPVLDAAPELERLARQRGEALYLPDGPLHLLPPQVLQAASLSDRETNECVTVAISLGEDGQVITSRMLLTLIPPVTRIRYDEANSLLDAGVEGVPAYRKKAAEELKKLLEAAERRRALTKRAFSEGKRVAHVKRNSEGELEAVNFQRSPAHLMVDEFLALYSEAGRRFCKAHSVTLPLAPGSVSGGVNTARFGTGPLRRYTDILAQKQMVSVLKGIKSLSRKEIAERMTQVNWQRATSQKLRSVSRNKVLLETFATYCATKAKASGQSWAAVTAVATGTGTEVFLPDVGLRSYVRLPGGWKKGQGGAPRRLFDLEAGREFEVRVLRVDPGKGSIDLEFANEEDAVGVELAGEEEGGEGQEGKNSA